MNDATTGRHDADKNWLALTREAPLDPALPIVDPHHHFYDQPGTRYLPQDALDDMRSGHNIRASVYIECNTGYRPELGQMMAPLGEIELANRIGVPGRGVDLCAGIVGFADLACGEKIGALLDAQMAAAGRFRGVRYTTKWDPHPSLRSARRAIPERLLYDSGVRAGMAQLMARGLSFDAFILHPQLVEIIDLARAFPALTIIIDHVGGLAAATEPYAARREEAFASWRGALTELARHPNVFMKLGGLAMPNLGLQLHLRAKPANSEELATLWRPYIEPCIEAFGPERCMFESNFPPDKLGASYVVLWNAFKRIAAGCTADVRHALFAGTGARAYRLALHPSEMTNS